VGKRTESFLAVVFLTPLAVPYQQFDPYKHFPDFASLWIAEFEPITIVRTSQFISHYVQMEVTLPDIPFHQEKPFYPRDTLGVPRAPTGIPGLPGHQGSWEALRAKSSLGPDSVEPYDALGCPVTL
jgi:hypothetical protein